MQKADRSEITLLLEAANRGDRSAVDRLLPLVYGELRALAGNFFGQQPADHTLQPTALVHEAYCRLADHTNGVWKDRRHFFNVAAMAMRQLLTDHARRQRAEKRGGGMARLTLNEALTPSSSPEVDLAGLDDALTKLAALDERQARIVELRFLAGLTVEETAELLGVSERTVKLDWQMARAYLRRELAESGNP